MQCCHIWEQSSLAQAVLPKLPSTCPTIAQFVTFFLWTCHISVVSISCIHTTVLYTVASVKSVHYYFMLPSVQNMNVLVHFVKLTWKKLMKHLFAIVVYCFFRNCSIISLSTMWTSVFLSFKVSNLRAHYVKGCIQSFSRLYLIMSNLFSCLKLSFHLHESLNMMQCF